MATDQEKPLAGLFRQIAEGHLQQAKEMLEMAEDELRKRLAGESATGRFVEDYDPVTGVIDAAMQLRLCAVVLKQDDEKRSGEHDPEFSLRQYEGRDDG